MKDQKLVDADGKQMSFEILLEEPAFERVSLPYVQWLARLGIDAHVRTVDSAQYQRLMDNYDLRHGGGGVRRIRQSRQRAEGLLDLRRRRSRKAATTSRAYAIRSVDALVARWWTRPTATTWWPPTHALDRVLLWGWYVVPHWHLPVGAGRILEQVRPPRQPVRTGVAFESWWIDPEGRRLSDAAAARAGTLMAAYLVRRLLLVIPTLFGIIAINFVVVQFAPGGPVEQMIAELKGHGGGITGRITGQGGAETRRRAPAAAPIAARAGSTRTSSPTSASMFGFDKPPLERFMDDAAATT